MTGQVWSQHTTGCTLQWFGRHLTRHGCDGWAEHSIISLPCFFLNMFFRTISKHNLGILGCPVKALSTTALTPPVELNGGSPVSAVAVPRCLFLQWFVC